MISLHPYLRNSGSVVALLARAEERGIPMQVRTKGNPKRGILVHWGKREFPRWQDYQRLVPILNHRMRLGQMTDKLEFFKHVGHDSGLVPEWTDSRNVAAAWDGDVVVRTKTAASGGEGLSISTLDQRRDGVELIAAPLYTRYQRKTAEYRCHVFRDERGAFSCRLTQRKAARRDVDGKVNVKNWQVRNLENGFVFVKNDGEPVPLKVTEVAIKLMQDYFPDLDFCALDVIYHKPSETALVLEGNTAPGLEGTNLDLYLDYFQERLNEH